MLLFCAPAVLINAQGDTFLPRFEDLISILHLLGHSGLLILLIILSNHRPQYAVSHNVLNGDN